MNFKYLINTFFLVTSLLLTNNIYGQTKPLLSSNSVKARSFFENAFRYYNNGDYEKTVMGVDDLDYGHGTHEEKDDLGSCRN